MASIRVLLVSGYVALCTLAFVEARLPCIFWTMIMPALPLALLVIGFAAWRRLCPLAAIASLGTRRSARRRLPGWVVRHPMWLSLSLLYAALVVRLLATNGDGPALGIFLALLALSAVFVNAWAGGKSWCNYLCPVGVVERIYTDPGPLAVVQANARCHPCSGCKKSCPDIDAERAYRASLDDADRRGAFYAFPGLVLAFYTAYWLRGGSWSAFFDGRWTTERASVAHALAPGWFFAPQLPLIVTAPLTLALGGALSAALFALLERAWTRKRSPDARATRHALLAWASFVAFNSFYSFAGAPALMRVPGVPRLAAFAIPLVATIALVRSAVRGDREGAQRRKQTMTDKSRKLRAPTVWPAPCSTRPPRRRVLPVVSGGGKPCMPITT